jgi:small subunit ribosomal protein S4e
MGHLKRQKAPRNWPIERKGTTFVVKPSSNHEGGLPLLIVLRDVLKAVQNRKEVKRAIHNKLILLNNRLVREDKTTVLLFDTIHLIPSKKSYRLELSENGKFKVSEIKETEINNKIAKIVDKKILKGKKVQINLGDGKNFLSDIKCTVGDSALINFKDKKIEKCLPLQEKANAVVFEGKHSGQKGTIDKLIPERKMAKLSIEGKEVNVLIKQLMVVA